jgi:hypothetical protein
MSLIKSFELLPAKNEKLKDYLYTELKNQNKWRENRSDAVQDQHNYYQTYIGNEHHVQKDLIPGILKEAEKVHLEYLNYHLTHRMKFLELANIGENYNLYLFDNDDKQLNIINFGIDSLDQDDNFNLELIDSDAKTLQLDSKLKEMKTYKNSLLLADMYSVYNITFDPENIENSKFSKQLTFDETPTQYLSDVLYDRTLLLNNHSVNVIDCSNFTLIQSKNLEIKNSLLKPFKKCDFFNTPYNIVLYNKTQSVLSDIRVK